MNWKKLISQNVGAEQLADVNTFVTSEIITNISSLDRYYEETRKILRAVPLNLDANEWLGSAYFVAIMSLTENYFRSILSEILKICLVTKKNAAENNINFGSVLWHPDEYVQRGAFEHISFSDSKKIAEITKKYVGVDINNLSAILIEYSKVCELRHGVVHSGRYLAGKNALFLDVPSSVDAIKITIGYAQLQSVASVCTTLVVSYNQRMFEVLCERWATGWRRSPFWDPNEENNLIKQIFAIFFSQIDSDDGTVPERGTWLKCRNLLKAEYNIA